MDEILAAHGRPILPKNLDDFVADIALEGRPTPSSENAVHVKRVLLAHNRYLDAARSGEDTVYSDEGTLLERAGMEVVRFEKRNEELAEAGLPGKLQVALTAGWSANVYREMSAILEKVRPDVAHFHNVFPQLTSAALAACSDAGVPVIHTLHNYRWRCASALLLREGTPCELCWTGNPLHAIRYSCYQGSAVATAAAVAAQLVQRRIHSRRRVVDRYIALTEFSRQKHIAAGMPPQLIEVKGNCIADTPSPGHGDGGYVLFAGRFGVEKGVMTLLEAWERLGKDAPPLRMFGGGPLDSFVGRRVAERSLNIRIVGPVPRSEVVEGMRAAAFVVVPSECYEGFPLVIAEALAAGTPVLASRTGGLPEMIDEGVTGRIFPIGDSGALAEAAMSLWNEPTKLRSMRVAARAAYEARFSAERTTERLLAIYDSAMMARRETARHE